ncbi:MAG: uncharacterized protein A8A55_0538 [Amphiamblys sp. WSBS2006]|nr:MAG: uncharacterized protein A8A55_0538 [Amphiamblys sp. WSBS2006]
MTGRRRVNLGEGDIGKSFSDKEESGMKMGPDHPVFKKKKDKDGKELAEDSRVDPIVPPGLEDVMGKEGEPDSDELKPPGRHGFF